MANTYRKHFSLHGFTYMASTYTENTYTAKTHTGNPYRSRLWTRKYPLTTTFWAKADR